jgi:hypothetical protein
VVALNDGIATLDVAIKKGRRQFVTATFSGTTALLPSTSTAVSLSKRSLTAAAGKGVVPRAAAARNFHSRRRG